jgi:hypothetical protein
MGQRMPAEGAPPAEAAAPQGAEAGAEGGATVESLAQNLATGLQAMTEIVQGLEQRGAAQGLSQEMAALQQGFNAVVDKLMGGGGGGQAPAGQGMATPEAGGAAVRPAGPA